MSSRNPRFVKISMEEKGKAITIETDDEEEDLQALIDEIEEVEDMEEDIQSARFAAKLPKYVPPWKGKLRYQRT